MKAQTTFDFGHVLAYMLPGFASVIALGYVSPRVATLLSFGMGKDTSTGGFFVLLLLSLAVGVVTSAARAWILDPIWTHGKNLNYAPLKDEHTLVAFKETVEHVYRFAQFYGNMCVAIFLLTALKLYSMFVNDANFLTTLSQQWFLFALLVATIVLLFVAHRGQLRDTYDKLEQILTTEEDDHSEESRQTGINNPTEENDHGEEEGEEEDRQKEKGQWLANKK